MTAPRRTQTERREATIGKLLEATIASLAERGYAATTAQEVVRRSGVSTGGLFRHFPTMLDLVVAAADEVRRRQFEQFRIGLAQLDGGSIEHSLGLLRAACRAPINGAWYDLLVAARSDEALRERLVPFTEKYHHEMAVLARTLPVAGLIPPARLETVIFSIVHMLDGEALAAIVHPQPEQEELRTQMMVAMLRGDSVYESAAEAG